jgi:hypothetical protein
MAYRRAGMFAVGEIVVVVVTLAALLWFGSQLLTAIEGENAQAESPWHGCAEARVYRISLDADGERMWVYRPIEGIVHINLASGRVEQFREMGSFEFLALAHSLDGSTSLLCTGTSTALWTRDRREPFAMHTGSSTEVSVDAAVSADGGMAIYLTSQGIARGWYRDGDEMKEVSYELPAGSTVIRMGLSHSGDRMCVARADGTVAIHSARTGVALTERVAAGGDFNTLVWSEDEQSIAVAGSGGILQLLDAEDLSCLWQTRLNGQNSMSMPTAIALSPDRKLIAVTFNGSTEISICPVNTNETVRQLQGHKGIVRALQFAPDSKSLYSGSFDGTIRQWNACTGLVLRVVD